MKDVHVEYQRLVEIGVHFTQPTVEIGPVITTIFDDTCGNLIQMAQMK